MSSAESSEIPTSPDEDVLSKITSAMGPIPKKKFSMLSPSCMNIIQLCIDSTKDLVTVLRDFDRMPILNEILERVRNLEQEISSLKNVLKEAAVNLINCVFCDKNSHTSEQCFLSIPKKYQILSEKQLCSRCLKSYSDTNHEIPCIANCKTCKEGHHITLHLTNETVSTRRAIKRNREKTTVRHTPR
uniref:DUF4206 domain-containing protein n=1 Tax=Heterorhabditis bacteriophora TaxID=37862 RepID=A0A1I7XGC2_HETBA